MRRNRMAFAALAGLAAAWAAGAAESAEAARPPFYVIRDIGTVDVLRDANGDGDALDVGENLVWATGLSSATGMATDGRCLYTADLGRVVVHRVQDLNGDGDALDAGESSVWADDFGSSWPVGVAAGPGGTVYVTGDDGSTWRLCDANGDGDALDAGEKMLYAAGIWQPRAILVERDGSLLVGSEQRICRLVDLNGDGDALDVGENLPYTPAPGSSDVQHVQWCAGLIGDGAGGVFASAPYHDTVYRVRDLNGDGDAMDLLEVLSYADPVYGNLDHPLGMVPFGGGGFLLADLQNDRVCLVRDTNGDGDALDLGEVVRYADVPGAAFVVNMPDPGTLGYNNVTLIEGDGNWNITHDAPFVSYGDGAELGVERIRAACGEGPTSVMTGAGGYNNEHGDITLAASIDYSGAGEAALALTAAGSITIAQPIFCADPDADRLDLTLTADAAGRGAGLVSVQAPVRLGDGALTATGSDFFSGFGGPIEAGTVDLTCPGGVHVGDLLSAAHHEIDAMATYVFADGEIRTGGGAVGGDLTVEPGGRITVSGGVFEVASSLPWALQGELELQNASLHGSPVMVTGTVRGRGAGSISAGLVCIGGPVLDCADAGDLLVLDGWLSITDLATLTKTGEGTLVINGPQDHGPGSVFEILGGTVDLNTAAGGAGTANLSILVDDAALHVGCNQYLDTLALTNGALVRFTGANVVVVKHLVMDGIDLGAMTLTPEPATLLLLAAGGLGLLAHRRRRRRSA